METVTEIDLNATATDGTVAADAVDKTIDLTSVYNGTVEAELSIGDTDLGSANITNGVLTLNAVPVTVYGNVNLIVRIVGDTVDTEITVPLFVVTKTIKTTAELRTLKDYTDNTTMQGGGYYRLGANIEKIGAWATGSGATEEKNYALGDKYGFKGTFDGNGYKLVSMAVCWNGVGTGFIKTLDGGTIKNVAFTDFVAGGYDGIIYSGKGSVENVLVSYNAKVGFASWKGVTSEAPNAGWSSDSYGTFSSETGSVISLKNVVIDLSAMEDAVWAVAKSQAIVGRISDSAQFVNVAVIGMKKSFIGAGGAANKGKMLFSEDGYSDGTTRANGKVYVAYSGADGDNGVAFPATGWTDNYWTVDADNKSITWKTK